MRLSVLLPVAALLAGCQLTVANTVETRRSFGAVAEAGTPAAPAAAASAAPAQAAANAGSALVIEPAPAATEAAPAEVVAPEAPDAVEAFVQMRAFVAAFEQQDAATVAAYESTLLSARRAASVTPEKFSWSIEQGHAEIFARGRDLHVVTADFKNLELIREGSRLRVKTKDGAPVLRATFSLDGKAGIHELAEIAFERGADGKVRVAALPADLASAARLPALEATIDVPASAIARLPGEPTPAP